LNLFRLEEEEHGRQKLQIERVQFEGKIKNFEDIVASQQNDLAKVKENYLFRKVFIVLFFVVTKRTKIF
jgi:hypothetical protein